MDPITAQRFFIETISSKYADKIELRLSMQAKTIQSSHAAQRSRSLSLAVSLYRYFELLLELVLAIALPPPKRNDATIFFEHQAYRQSDRVKYLTYMLGEGEFIGISRSDRIRGMPDKKAFLRIMPRLAVSILVSALRWSDLAKYYVWITRACLLTLSYAAPTNDKEIYLFSIYRIETPFIAAFLKERGIVVNLVASSTRLSAYNRVLIGDSLKASTAYQCDEFQHYQHLGLGDCPTCELWAPHTIYVMAERYRGMQVEEHLNVVGVYTQGFWLRASMGILRPEAVQRTVLREEELLKIMLEWVKLQPDTRLVIFPHPLERRHFRETNEHQFDEILKDHQIDIDLMDTKGSYMRFERVGLGVTTLSSVGFDRIHMGFRTLFYTLPLTDSLANPNPDVESSYNRLFIPDKARFLDAVERTRRMTHREFMHEYFGQEFFQR